METLSRIAVPATNQLNSESQEILNGVKGQLGMVPNLYATIGYSSNALSSYLQFSGNAGKGTFSNKELEAIKLAVSEANGCAYCKAAHTAIAKMNGFTDEETVQLRNATIADEKLRALTLLAQETVENGGHASEEAKERFFAQGYDEKALIDFVAVLTEITFTNYAHGLTQVEVDFPSVN